MDTKEILLTVEAISNEKNILKSDVFRGLELGLIGVADKQFGEGHDVKINQGTGEWITTDESGKQIENIGIGRISGQVVKNALFQHVKAVSEEYKFERMLTKVGNVINCKIHRVNKSSYICLAVDDEFVLPFRDCISKEKFRVGDIISVVVKLSNHNGKDKIYLSRLDEALVVEMLSMEVPEIGEGAIEVIACARVPGFKSKVVVWAKDPRLDAVGVCIGMRGSRVRTITEELGGEFVEIIQWDDDANIMINNITDGDAVVEIELNETECIIIAEDDSIGLAIGRGGINVDLIQKIVGVKTKVIGKGALIERQAVKKEDKVKEIVLKLGVNGVDAGKLVESGFDDISSISEVNSEESFDKIGITISNLDEIIETALDFLLVDAMDKSEKWEELENLINDDSIINKFEQCGIKEVADVADLSVDELKTLVGGDDDWCGEVIIESRKMEGMI